MAPAPISHDLAREIANDVANDILQDIKDSMDKHDKVFTGDARDSWEIRRVGNKIIIESKSPAMWHVEYGRQPNRRPPPAAEIEKWLSGKVGLEPSEAKRKSYAVAKKIGKEGTKPTYIVDEVMTRYVG